MELAQRFRTTFHSDSQYLMHSKSVLLVMIGVWLFAYVAPLIATFFFDASTFSYWDQIFLGSSAIGTCMCGWLLYRRRITESATLLLSIAWLSTTLFLVTRGGIRIPVSQFYALIIVAATFLIGRRIGLLVAILSLLTAVTLGWTESIGLLPEPVFEISILRYFSVHFLFLILITTITYLISIDVHRNFRRAQEATEKAQERQQKLEQYARQLEATNAELAISERRYRHFFNGTPVMMHSIDQQGNLMDVNEFWLSTLGYEKDEVIGRRSTEFLTPESQRYATEEVLPIYFKNGYIENVPYQMAKKSGELIDVLLSASELKDEEGNFLHSLASISDITEQKQIETELRESEQRFRTLVNSAADCVLLLNSEGKLINVNDHTCHVLGYTRDELIGMSVTEFDAEWTPPRMMALAEKMELNVPETITSTLIHKDGRHIPVEIRAVIIRLDDEPAFLGLARDVSEQKRAQLALKASEHRFRSLIFNQAQQFIGLVELDGTLSEVNHSALEFGETKREAIIGKYFWDTPYWTYDADVQARLIDAVHAAANGTPVQYEVDVRGGNNEFLTIDFSLSPIRNEQDEVISILAEGRDITELHQSALALNRSVQESELLLKEIHHRVKNNLQIVSSILRLQAGKTDDATILNALNESQLRIRSMQLIHEQLYRSDNVSRIDLASYFRTLTTEALRIYRHPNVKVDVLFNLANIEVSIDTATTCGFIYHEIISNALKYAFSPSRPGTIMVELQTVNEAKAKIVVEDDGFGVPADTPFPNPDSLGFRLIQLLAAQISAPITLEREPNTRFELFFALEP